MVDGGSLGMWLLGGGEGTTIGGSPGMWSRGGGEGMTGSGSPGMWRAEDVVESISDRKSTRSGAELSCTAAMTMWYCLQDASKSAVLCTHCKVVRGEVNI
jgi:hypothetical protein